MKYVLVHISMCLVLLSLGACTFTSTASPTPLGQVLLKLIVPVCDPAMTPCANITMP